MLFEVAHFVLCGFEGCLSGVEDGLKFFDYVYLFIGVFFVMFDVVFLFVDGGVECLLLVLILYGLYVSFLFFEFGFFGFDVFFDFLLFVFGEIKVVLDLIVFMGEVFEFDCFGFDGVCEDVACFVCFSDVIFG